jgi:hypothetical protein
MRYPLRLVPLLIIAVSAVVACGSQPEATLVPTLAFPSTMAATATLVYDAVALAQLPQR